MSSHKDYEQVEVSFTIFLHPDTVNQRCSHHDQEKTMIKVKSKVKAGHSGYLGRG